MAVNVILHQFANDVGPIPLSLLDNNFAALTTALASLDTYSNLYTDIGTQNALNVQTPAWQHASYTDGLTIQIRPATTNTGPVTLNINALGPVPVINNDGTPLVANQLVAGQLASLTYDAKRNAFVLNAGGGAAETVTSPSAPSNPIEGQFWFDTSNGRLGIYSGGAWVSACCNCGGATSGNLFAPPFTVGDCFSIQADCSLYLGKGLSMGADGHTWLYQGLTTYPLGGLTANPSTPSYSLHGNANATASWLAAQLDDGGAETYIGGIGGGATMSGVSPGTLQILGLQGIALGTNAGGTPCLTFDTNCNATFNGAVTGPTAATGTANNQLATTSFVSSTVTSAVQAAVNPPGGSNIAATGHSTLPNGLIFKWGYVQQGGGTPMEIRINFSPAFPHACFFGIGVTLGTGIRNNASGMPSAVSASGMTILFDALDGQNNVMNGGYWMAIGN